MRGERRKEKVDLLYKQQASCLSRCMKPLHYLCTLACRMVKDLGSFSASTCLYRPAPYMLKHYDALVFIEQLGPNRTGHSDFRGRYKEQHISMLTLAPDLSLLRRSKAILSYP